MPVETTVTVITQTLRINACIDFINSIGGDSRITVFTGDPGAFEKLDLPAGISVMSSTAPGLLLADPARLKRVGRRRLLEWMRSGSRIGKLSELAARKLLRMMRPVNYSSSQEPAAVANTPTNSFLVEELEKLHETHALSTIAVFDVFDLPSVMTFAAGKEVHVIVR